jgi:hypothetical protein
MADTLTSRVGAELTIRRAGQIDGPCAFATLARQMSCRAVAEGHLRNRTLRAGVEADPAKGSRSDADSAVVDGDNRWCRFDLREGHDLERLLWPDTGSGDSTGLLRYLSVVGRHDSTGRSIKPTLLRSVKPCRSTRVNLRVDRATASSS